MPATMSSCLNSCGDCGSAYQLPGRSRAGTRKSRAPSGVERVIVGVSISTKPRSCSVVARDPVRLAAQPDAPRAGPVAAQVEVAVAAAAPPRRPGVLVDLEGQRRRLVEHRRARWRSTSISPVASAGLTLPLGTRADLAGHRRLHALVAHGRGRGRVAARNDHLDDARGVAQVDERHPAVVAAAGHPAGEGDGLCLRPTRRRLPASWVRITVLSFTDVGQRRDHRGRRSGGRGRPGRRIGGHLVAAADVLHLVGPCRPRPGNQTNGMPRRSA